MGCVFLASGTPAVVGVYEDRGGVVKERKEHDMYDCLSKELESKGKEGREGSTYVFTCSIWMPH